MLTIEHAGVQELSPDELQSTSGGCELFCAIARKLGYAYGRSLRAAGAVWKELTDGEPSLCYQAKEA